MKINLDNNQNMQKNYNDMLHYGNAVSNEINNKNASGIEKKDIGSVGECETCNNRRYQDGSNDAGVSFKSPQKIAKGTEASAVLSHEMEHYNREEANAISEGKEVLSNSIKLFTATWPDCGRSYVSGGETTTVTATKNDVPEDVKKQMNLKGSFIDLKV